MLFCILAISLFSAQATRIDSSNVDAAFAFQSFVNTYSKVYSSDEEYETRFAIFQSNLNVIANLNAQRESDDEAWFGINKFADLSPEEFRESHLNYERQKHQDQRVAGLFNRTSIKRTVQWDSEDRVDWREKNAVTDVKDQGQCGSCWAFSATEEIESMWYMAGNRLVELSPQQIVSCDKVDGGCNGGDTPTAYEYVIEAGGIELESSYPYTARDDRCKFDDTQIAATITGYTWAIPECKWYKPKCDEQDEVALADALAASPISICVNAEPWQFYVGGVVHAKHCSGAYNKLDHCVQLVGYDRSGSTPYWMVRNSWATDWGVEGYIHLAMDENACGVADEATVATV